MRPCQTGLIGLLVSSVIASGQTESRSQQYLRLFASGIKSSEEQLPAMESSAVEAARRLTAGGTIWAAGPRDDFTIEAYIRAGGLMCLKLLEDKVPAAGDVVLYGAGGAIGRADLSRLGKWQAAGAYVVAFATRPPEHADGTPDTLIDNGPSSGLEVSHDGALRLCPVDTVLDAVNLWVWTAELAAACTRLNRMPIFYQSVVRPGGRERNRPYAGKTFHDDVAIDPIGAGVLGRKYLAEIRACLTVVGSQHEKMAQVARWWREDTPDPALVLALGHLFPSHLRDSRAPQWAIESARSQDPALGDQAMPVFFRSLQVLCKDILCRA